MKSLILAAGATIALALPTLASAQDVKTVYRPEVHGTVIVVPQDARQDAAGQHATHQHDADAAAPAAAKHQCCEKKMSAMADMKKP